MNTSPLIHLTPEARERLIAARSANAVPADWKIRIGIRGGGCGVMGYIIGFDEAKETDNLYKVDELEIIVDKRHAMYILGMEVDYHESPEQQGFVFNNPTYEKSS